MNDECNSQKNISEQSEVPEVTANDIKCTDFKENVEFIFDSSSSATLSSSSDEECNQEIIKQKIQVSKVTARPGFELVPYDETSSDDESNDELTEVTYAKLRTELDNNDSDDSFTEEPMRTEGELTISDLPPLDKLDINECPPNLCKLGKISSIVDVLVIVATLPKSPPLDIDTVLFLGSNKPLGKIFETFGPVLKPFYSVRFNNIQEINDLSLKVNDDVFFSPHNDTLTKFIFVNDLLRQKGSDASWKFNNEPPADKLDYSDDEIEIKNRKKDNRLTKKTKKNNNIKNNKIHENEQKPLQSILTENNDIPKCPQIPIRQTNEKELKEDISDKKIRILDQRFIQQ